MPANKKKTAARTSPSTSQPRPQHAHSVEPDIKEGNLRRLNRIEGQVRGVRQMIEDDRYCADILDQISAIQNALGSVARETLRNHLKHCVSAALEGTAEESACMQEELLKLFDKRMH